MFNKLISILSVVVASVAVVVRYLSFHTLLWTFLTTLYSPLEGILHCALMSTSLGIAWLSATSTTSALTLDLASRTKSAALTLLAQATSAIFSCKFRRASMGLGKLTDTRNSKQGSRLSRRSFRLHWASQRYWIFWRPGELFLLQQCQLNSGSRWVFHFLKPGQSVYWKSVQDPEHFWRRMITYWFQFVFFKKPASLCTVFYAISFYFSGARSEIQANGFNYQYRQITGFF